MVYHSPLGAAVTAAAAYMYVYGSAYNVLLTVHTCSQSQALDALV